MSTESALHVGKIFQSFRELNEAVSIFCQFSKEPFVIADCKKISTENAKLCAEMRMSENDTDRLVYSYVRYGCCHRRDFRSHSTGKRYHL